MGTRVLLSLTIVLIATVSAGAQDGKQDDNQSKLDANKEPKSLREEKTIFGKWFQRDTEEDSGEEAPLASDRPDFTESSTNVGKGRLQLEMGYTYYRDRIAGGHQNDSTFPELLMRYGVFADWLELRVGGSFATSRVNNLLESTSDVGAQDVYLGVGLALMEQRGILPEFKVTLQTFVPTGHRAFTAGEPLPGINILYGWDIIKDKWTLGASTQFNRRANDLDGFYLESAQSLTTGIALTKNVGMYIETFALFPDGARDPGIGPEYYLDSGFTWLVRPNLQFDIRAGMGLNRHATDFFTGTGLVIRF